MSLISFDHVSKEFRLGRERASSFQELWLSVVRPQAKRSDHRFLALDDVSFVVSAGETLGFVGANGAGKSSILKLIAGILEPTAGRIDVEGRVSALLELGSGFHPDLTGRDNIFLNGSIMGLRRDEIASKVDDIVAFAELERFIDVPVKHYSSGMYVRLGFSVAVHTEPEILLVDEVLSVGDQEFQQKCWLEISRLQESGVTIVLVSHSLADVETLCDRAIWIKDGRVAEDGDALSVTDAYRSFSNRRFYERKKQDQQRMPRDPKRWGTGEALITAVELFDSEMHATDTFTTGESFRLRLHYHAPNRIYRPTFGLAFYREDGLHVNGPNSVRDGHDIAYIEGKGYVDYFIESLPLNSGQYDLTVALYNRSSTVAFDHHHRHYRFRVESGSLWSEEGVLHIPAVWEHTPL